MSEPLSPERLIEIRRFIEFHSRLNENDLSVPIDLLNEVDRLTKVAAEARGYGASDHAGDVVRQLLAAGQPKILDSHGAIEEAGRMIEELLVEIKAYQGLSAGGLPGWAFDGREWGRDFGPNPASRETPPARREAFVAPYGMRLYWCLALRRPTVGRRDPLRGGYADTPREAMRRADEAARSEGWLS